MLHANENQEERSCVVVRSRPLPWQPSPHRQSPSNGRPSRFAWSSPIRPAARRMSPAASSWNARRISSASAILFDNKAGASGMIGAEFVKNQPVDHHTFLTTTTAMVCITRHLQPIPFDPDPRHRPGVAHDDLVGRLRHSSLGAGQHASRSSWPMRKPIPASSTTARPASPPSPICSARCSASKPASR